jgi:predicted  nucleic acid-binding Zn-ribbon protein
VDRLKTSETKLGAQVEAHKVEVEDLKKKLAEMNENFEVTNAKHEISEIFTTIKKVRGRLPFLVLPFPFHPGFLLFTFSFPFSS